MKVRFIRLLNGMGQEIASSPWARIGDDYDALSLVIEQGENGRIFVRILGRGEPGPTLHFLNEFEIVDSSIPSNWGVFPTPRGNGLFIGPAAWAEPGYWEKFFDGDPDAVRAFEERSSETLHSSSPQT
jgi:hypothetical protein